MGGIKTVGYGCVTYTFFPLPFLPLDRRLFLPTAWQEQAFCRVRAGSGGESKAVARLATSSCWHGYSSS